MTADYEHPINISLIRPHLVAGVEKIGLAASVIPAGVGLLVAGQGGYRYAAVLAILSVLMYLGFRQLAKEDAYLCAVYFRSLRYRRFYHPRPTVFRRYKRKVPHGAGKVAAIVGMLVMLLGIIVVGVVVSF